MISMSQDWGSANWPNHGRDAPPVVPDTDSLDHFSIANRLLIAEALKSTSLPRFWYHYSSVSNNLYNHHHVLAVCEVIDRYAKRGLLPTNRMRELKLLDREGPDAREDVVKETVGAFLRGLSKKQQAAQREKDERLAKEKQHSLASEPPTADADHNSIHP